MLNHSPDAHIGLPAFQSAPVEIDRLAWMALVYEAMVELIRGRDPADEESDTFNPELLSVRELEQYAVAIALVQSLKNDDHSQDGRYSSALSARKKLRISLYELSQDRKLKRMSDWLIRFGVMPSSAKELCRELHGICTATAALNTDVDSATLDILKAVIVAFHLTIDLSGDDEMPTQKPGVFNLFENSTRAGRGPT